MSRAAVVISPSFLTCDVTRRCIRARRTPALLKRRSSRNSIKQPAAMHYRPLFYLLSHVSTFMFPDYSACLLNLLFRSSVMVWSILDILSAHSQLMSTDPCFTTLDQYTHGIFFFLDPTTTLHHPLYSISSISWLNFNTFEILLIPCILGSSFFVHLFRSSFMQIPRSQHPGNNSYLIPIRQEHLFYFCVIIIINYSIFHVFFCFPHLPHGGTLNYTYGAIGARSSIR